jgi:hypothetical protein
MKIQACKFIQIQHDDVAEVLRLSAEFALVNKDTIDIEGFSLQCDTDEGFWFANIFFTGDLKV